MTLAEERQLETKRRETAIRAALTYRKNGGDTTGDDWNEYRSDMAAMDAGTLPAGRIGFAAQSIPTVVEAA